MSIYSLETAKKDGFVRIAAEMLVLFVGYTVVFLVAVEPALRAAAPDVFVQAGLEYSRTDLPDTALEYVHLLGSCVIVGGFFYWRLHFTELGATFRDAVREDRES